MDKNVFCNLSDLKNEASVESFFVDRLIENLGFEDSDISLKESISEFAVGKGGKKILYRPDYILKISGIPTIVIDAKSPDQNIIEWEHQCSSYCLELNKEFDYNPVEYYVLTNGLETSLYKWDKKNQIINLKFEDFETNSEIFIEFKSLLDKSEIKRIAEELRDSLEIKDFELKKLHFKNLTPFFKNYTKKYGNQKRKVLQQLFMN